jgi:hypothetical protein
VVVVQNDCVRVSAVTRPNVNHTFHLLMTVFTLGAWFPVWMTVWIISLFRRSIRRAV